MLTLGHIQRFRLFKPTDKESVEVTPHNGTSGKPRLRCQGTGSQSFVSYAALAVETRRLSAS
jgi:hypothetical protein